MAQEVERILGKDEVTSSTLVSSSKKKHFLFGKCFFLCPQGHNSDFCSVALVCRSEAKFVDNYRNFKYNNIQLKVSEGELNGG